jgi:hypothetical protein
MNNRTIGRRFLKEVRQLRFYTKANTWNHVLRQFNERYECVKNSTMKLKEVETNTLNLTDRKVSSKIYECECQRKLCCSASSRTKHFNLHFAFSEFHDLYRTDGIYHLYYIKTRDVPVDIAFDHFQKVADYSKYKIMLHFETHLFTQNSFALCNVSNIRLRRY